MKGSQIVSRTTNILHLPWKGRATRTKPADSGSKTLDFIKSAQADLVCLAADFSLTSFFSASKFYLLPFWFATSVLIGSTAVVSFAAPPEIAQVVVGGSVNRPTLKLGSQGERVSELQGALKLLGYYTGTVDGNFNQTTANAVSQFKQAAGLAPDGIVDGNTWQRLFPGEGTVASSPASPNPASNFPTPEPKPSSPRATTSTSQTTVRQSSPGSGTSTSRSEQTLRTTSTNGAGQTSSSEQTVRSTSTTGSEETVRTRQTPETKLAVLVKLFALAKPLETKLAVLGKLFALVKLLETKLSVLGKLFALAKLAVLDKLLALVKLAILGKLFVLGKRLLFSTPQGECRFCG